MPAAPLHVFALVFLCFVVAAGVRIVEAASCSAGFVVGILYYNNKPILEKKKNYTYSTCAVLSLAFMFRTRQPDFNLI